MPDVCGQNSVRYNLRLPSPAALVFNLLLLTADPALHLDSPHDQAAMRHWFTFLAESQFFNPPAARPREINDCAALIRYAYREALRKHDARWAADAGLPLILPFDSIAKYNYPRTPTGPALFRVRGGNGSEAFAQFADVKTLRAYNTRFVSRDIGRARPGDLLFYRNSTGFHSMIYAGRSHYSDDPALYVVYHTGPAGGEPGEIRRPSIAELMRHPDPQWRPVGANPHFLGVFCWNIL